MLLVILKILTFVVMLFICFLFFNLFKRLGQKAENIDVSNEIDKVVKKKGLASVYKKKMSKLGIMYRVGDYDLKPSWYILSRVLIAIIMFLIGIGLVKSFFIAVIGFFAGFVLVGVYFKRKNTQDNKAMLMDIYNTYVTLKIQTQAGIYIANSIEYAYKIAQNERYREALRELVINISDKTIPMSTAINIFKDRFDSREINKLCALLHNFVTYGAQEAYTKDIMGEIQSIVLADSLETEHAIESKAGLITFAFFAIVIFITAYSIVLNFAEIDLFL